MDKLDSKKSVLVAMSGGVDSTAVALMLKEQGFDVRGIHFILLKEKDSSEKVRNIAKKVGIPLRIEDISEDFKKTVIDYFVFEYAEGRTPNPCIICNPQIKFSYLLDFAESENISNIATGHYVCVYEKCGKFLLKKAIDKRKDQSYFLHRLTQKNIKKSIFPLCEKTKEQVKEYVLSRGVKIEDGESQDVCFFHAKESLANFLEKSIEKRRGEIVDENGNMLGFHDGIEFFTIGQRHGLDINGGPFYVIKKKASENELIVSKDRDHPSLLARKIRIKDPSWILDEPKENTKYQMKTRYLCSETTGEMQRMGNEWIAVLDEPQWAASPGQSLVLYKRDNVVGGGIIEEVFND